MSRKWGLEDSMGCMVGYSSFSRSNPAIPVHSTGHRRLGVELFDAFQSLNLHEYSSYDASVPYRRDWLKLTYKLCTRPLDMAHNQPVHKAHRPR